MEAWYQVEEKALIAIYKATHTLGGTISGEHGIGSKRKRYMNIVKGPAEMDLMKRIKRAFDPHTIMNPHKIFDV